MGITVRQRLEASDLIFQANAFCFKMQWQINQCDVIWVEGRVRKYFPLDKGIFADYFYFLWAKKAG
jgi:hypothetical protein